MAAGSGFVAGITYTGLHDGRIAADPQDVAIGARVLFTELDASFCAHRFTQHRCGDKHSNLYVYLAVTPTTSNNLILDI